MQSQNRFSRIWKGLEKLIAPIILASALASPTYAQEDEKPEYTRATYWNHNNGNNYFEIGHGQNIFNEKFKIRRAENDEEDYIFASRFKLGERTDLSLTTSSEREGAGLESVTKVSWGGFSLAADRVSDSTHLGGGIDYVHEKLSFGIGLDVVDSEGDTRDISPFTGLIFKASPKTKLGVAYQQTNGEEDKKAFSGFVSHGGADTPIGGRAWAYSNHNGNGDSLTFGEVIIGQNFARPYTDFVVKRTATGGDLHAKNLVPNLLGSVYSEYDDPWDRSVGGFVLSAKAGESRTAEEGSSFLRANLAYVSHIGDATITPLLSWNDDSGFGGGFEITKPLGFGILSARIEGLGSEEARGLISFSIKN